MNDKLLFFVCQKNVLKNKNIFYNKCKRMKTNFVNLEHQSIE